ncbi:hypothetical protein J1N35_033949 [Gossypium stocksii]|uniref:Uncharacterized protein n=1 Tax=Gossypium stocksii TaxID=47602 RepID=A0A9D3ZPL4_9ROSI|nr:hypothetical protein J1N35_033949 [Gossypium stocksii]
MYLRYSRTTMCCAGESRHEGRTKVLSAIQPAKDVYEGKNIDSIDLRSATKTLLGILEGQQTNMKPVELLERLPLKKEVACASDFEGKVVMQTEQLRQVNATSEIHLKHFGSVFNFDLA